MNFWRTPTSDAVRLSVEAELRSRLASIQLVDLDLADSVESELVEPGIFRLDLGLTPRPADARLRFRQRRSRSQFRRPGHLFLLPPDEAIEFKSGVGHQRLLICRLLTDSLCHWLEMDIQWTAARLDASLDISNARIRHLLLSLGEETRNPGLASELLLESMVAQLAVELLRHYEGISEPAVTGQLAEWRLRLIDERLTDEVLSPTLTELATLCRLSVRQLSRSFLNSRGMTLGQYVKQKQLERARQMLQAGDSVKAIAYSLGFSSPSSFCYAFRKALGVTPGQFRQSLK
jgi:AraC family transcriptional regulator